MGNRTVPLALVVILDQARRLLWQQGVEATDAMLRLAHDSLPVDGRTYHAVACRYVANLLARMEGQSSV